MITRPVPLRGKCNFWRVSHNLLYRRMPSTLDTQCHQRHDEGKEEEEEEIATTTLTCHQRRGLPLIFFSQRAKKGPPMFAGLFRGHLPSFHRHVLQRRNKQRPLERHKRHKKAIDFISGHVISREGKDSTNKKGKAFFVLWKR